ncbi:MAG: hypothetical protein IJS04_02330 [Muribaculaceae bacterium]|nr:hypothetical protein [Muribaculaceae bacterium]
MSIGTPIAFIVGVLLGIVIDRKARKERDERIAELEKQFRDSQPVRVCDDSLRGINKEQTN